MDSKQVHKVMVEEVLPMDWFRQVIRPLRIHRDSEMGRIVLELRLLGTSLSQIWQGPPLKALVALSLALSWMFPAPNTHPGMAIALLLLILDTLTGAVAAVIQGHGLSSRRFGRVIIKFFGYSVLIIVAHVVPKAMWPEAEAVAVTIALGLIVTTEATSVLENLIKMGLPIPLQIVALLKDVKPSQVQAIQKELDRP